MYDWIFYFSLFLVTIFCLIAWVKNIPAFFAIAGLILFLTSIIVMIDGGIEIGTKQINQIGNNYLIVDVFDSNTMISTNFSDSPIMWGLSYIGMFMGFLFMGYSLGLTVQEMDRNAIKQK